MVDEPLGFGEQQIAFGFGSDRPLPRQQVIDAELQRGSQCRIGGADLNPYLAFAALLAAGLDGVERKLPLEPAFSGDAYDKAQQLREVPKTLREARALLDDSRLLREVMGDEVIDHYVHTADWEQLEFDRRVTDLELKRGFERY